MSINLAPFNVFSNIMTPVITVCTALLIYLILYRSKSNMGTYKHLLVTSAVSSLLMQYTVFFYEPLMYISTHGYVIFCNNTYLKSHKELARQIGYLFSALFSNVAVIISVQYIYRLCAILGQEKLRFFKGKYLVAWIVGVIFVDAAWYIMINILNPTADLYDHYIEEPIMEAFGQNISETVHFGPLLWYEDSIGNIQIHIGTVILLIYYYIILMTTNILMVVVGAIIIRKTGSSNSQVSQRTKKMQRKLMKVLFMQSAAPFFLMYVPDSIIVVLEVLESASEKTGLVMLVFLEVYSLTESLIVIFFIDDYRNTIRSLLFGRSQVSPTSKLAVTNQGSSTRTL